MGMRFHFLVTSSYSICCDLLLFKKVEEESNLKSLEGE